jgi:hypothetical protein
LFVGVPVVFGLVRIPGGPIPLLIVLGPLAYWYLRRRPDYDRRDLTRPEALRASLPAILGLWAVAALVAVFAIAVFLPGWLFNLPRQQPPVKGASGGSTQAPGWGPPRPPSTRQS